MRHLDPSIPFEKQLGKQIYKALQGPVVEKILESAKLSTSDDYWRSIMEGHSLKVEESLLKDLYGLCTSVQEKLGFKEPVDYYVTGDASVNAFSVAAEQ